MITAPVFAQLTGDTSIEGSLDVGGKVMISNGSEVPLFIGPTVSTPTGVTTGEFFVGNDGVLYVYDGVRSKWLSVDSGWIGGGRNNANQGVGYLRAFNGNTMSASVGYVMPRNGTIVAMSVARTDTDSVTWQVHANGAYLTGATITTSAVRDYVDSLNVDFSAGQTLAIYQSSGTSGYPNVTVWYRWRR